jgi:2',3'-cyclic-nucleotide 2'-phosphodiesterase/3'-nucleotidase
VLSTNDVHGTWFDSTYVDGKVRKSLFAMNYYIDSVRTADGCGNVLLVDAGDCLQGDNAPYYFNYIDTLTPHLFPRLLEYMQYDAVAMGNHDIETGHPVYDKVDAQLAAHGIPFLAANAVRTSDGEPYFAPYKVFRRGGMKVAVTGFTNPNMKAWLSEPIWRGIEFKSLIPCAQEWVDRVRAKEKPDVVVVLTHSGTGEGDGSVLESQGLDLLESLQGVDVLVCSHDHRPFVKEKDGTWLINGGARAGNVGHALVTKGKQNGKTVRGETVRMDKSRVDGAMEGRFLSAFGKVRDFTRLTVGQLTMELRTRDAYAGMCDYLNLLHTVQLDVPEAQLSFAAPLTFNGTVKSGEVIYNDMFTIYPYENALYVLRLTGSEIKGYLERSYDKWIQTLKPGGNVLNIVPRSDPRNDQIGWSFVERSYNFDSASGINYTVDVTKPCGARVKISSMADGSAFDPDREYTVAMTSYRAAGGGDLLFKGAGLTREQLAGRTEARYPEIRDLIFRYFQIHGVADPETIANPPAVQDGDRILLGDWKFVPEEAAKKAMSRDMTLMFGRK